MHVAYFCEPDLELHTKSKTTLNYWMIVVRYPNLKEEVGGSFPAVKSFSLLIENLSGGQLPHVLWHWHVGLLSPKKNQDYDQR